MIAFLTVMLLQDRAPVPDAAALKQAEKTVKEAFKELYKKKTPEGKIVSAQTLLDQGIEDPDPPRRYVCFREAASLAAEAGDLTLALKAAGRLGADFAVDAAAQKIETIKSVKGAEPRAVAEAYLGAGREAVAADDYKGAKTAFDAAAAKKAKDELLTARATASSKGLAAAEAEFKKAQKALETLESAPDDPQANGDAGRFLCLIKGDWKRGLPMLAKGTDSKLKEAAEAELGTAVPPKAADLWRELALAEKGEAAANLRRHAASVYFRVLPAVDPTLKPQAEKRFSEMVGPIDPSEWALANQDNASKAWPLTELKAPKVTPAGELTVRDTTPLTNFIAVKAVWRGRPLTGDFSGTVDVRDAFAFQVADASGADVAVSTLFKGDGQWHTITFTKKGAVVSYTIDGGPGLPIGEFPGIESTPCRLAVGFSPSKSVSIRRFFIDVP